VERVERKGVYLQRRTWRVADKQCHLYASRKTHGVPGRIVSEHDRGFCISPQKGAIIRIRETLLVEPGGLPPDSDRPSPLRCDSRASASQCASPAGAAPGVLLLAAGLSICGDHRPPPGVLLCGGSSATTVLKRLSKDTGQLRHCFVLSSRSIVDISNYEIARYLRERRILS
jgi:hypothetical protein